MRRTRSRLGCRWLCTLLACAITWLQCIPPSLAADFRVFRKTYIRDADAPDTIVDSFSILNPQTTWQLRAVNGSLEDTSIEKVSSSTLNLNGVEILQPSQFSQNVNVIEIPLALQTQNVVKTQVRSRPGGQLTIEIVGQDDAPPTIQWLTPADGQSLNTQTVAARLRLTDDISGLDPATLEILLDGVPVQRVFSPLGQPVLSATLDGSLTATDGPHTLYAQVRDRAGQLASASVSFSVLTGPPVTPESGFIHGRVFHAVTEQPLVDAVIAVRGITGDVRSDADGRFQFPTPGSGEFVVEITKEGFTPVQRRVEVLSTRDVAVAPAFLTPLDPNVTLIRAGEAGLARDSTGEFEVEFPAGAAPRDLAVRITPLPDEEQLPGPLPEGRQHVQAVYFEPRFTVFNQPATVRFRNTKNFPPNTVVNLELWNEDEQRWMDVDPGMVTPDGQWVEFRIIRFFCWYCGWTKRRLPAEKKEPVAQHIMTTTTEADSPDKKCPQNEQSSICPESGALSEEHTLPAIRTLGQSRTLTFTHRSTTASPSVLIGTDYVLDTVGDPAEGPTVVPVTTSATIQIEGQLIQASFSGASGSLRQAFLWDGRNARSELVPTGAYPYTVKLSNDYQETFGDTGIPTGELAHLTTTVQARAILVNQRGSPFGAGWSLNGLQRLLPQPDGTMLVTDGDGSATVFRSGPLPDVAVTSYLADEVSVLTGHGDGTFQPPQRLAVAGRPLWTGVADLNDDGFDDIAVRLDTGELGDVVILYGLGGGAFRPPERVSVDLTFFTRVDFHADGIAADDFNEDGLKDLAFAGGGTVSLLLGSPGGTFQTGGSFPVGRFPESIVTAEFNGDGRRDVAVANVLENSLSILLGNGDGTFQPERRTPASLATSFGRTGLTSGDFNGDGVSDLAHTNYEGAILSVALGVGDGSFTSLRHFSVAGFPVTVVAADLDQDGNQDLAVANEVGSVSVLLGKGNGDFQRQRRFLLARGSAGLAVGEFNDQRGNPIRTFTGLPGDFSRLEQHPDGTFIRHLTDGTQVMFDARGFHQKTVDRNGNETRYLYDGQDRLSRVEFPGGAVYDFAYSPLNGHLSSVIDSAGRATQFLINGDANLRKLTNPDGTIRQFTYDAEHRLISQTNERGFTTDYHYDAFGRIQEAILPERPVFDPATSSVTPQREIRHFIPSDTQGLINTLPAGVGTPENPAAAVPTPLANFQDGRGNTTQLLTDHFGTPTKLIDPLGRTTTIVRDVNGQPSKITQPNGHHFEFSYDSRGNLTVVREDHPNFVGAFFTTRFTYEPNFSQVTSITDPRSATTSFEYDARGNLTRLIDALGHATELTYDSRGLLTTVTDALGTVTPEPDDHQARFAYDLLTGNLLNTTDPLGRSTQLAYDAFGNVERSTDATGHATGFTYDVLNRLTEVRDALSQPTVYSYDAAGNLLRVTDAATHSTTFTYDSLNLLASITNPVGQTKQFFYDANRNLGQLLDAEGQTSTFQYDAANQLETKILKNAAGAIQDTVAYDYDSLGNLALVQDSDSRLAFIYDAAGRLVHEIVGDAGHPEFAQPPSTLQYTYDQNGNRAGLGCPQCVGLSYTYDGLNRLINVVSQGRFGGSFDYDALWRLVKITTGHSGVRSTFAYDDASQLLTVRNMMLAPLDYTYDALGNRRTLTDHDGLHTFGYDALNRLTGADHPLASVLPDETFTYDPVGNRLTSHLSALHRYEAANRLLEDDQFFYTYDANGNLTDKTDKTDPTVRTVYTYDVENQLTRIDLPDGGVAQYRYDGLGRRIEKDVAGAIQRFLYDQEDLLARFTGPTNCQTHAYLHGPGLDEPLAYFEDREANCHPFGSFDAFGDFLRDGLGSVTGLTRGLLIFPWTNQLAERYTYASFGSPTITTAGPDETFDTADDVLSDHSAFDNPYLFTGQEFDVESGLYYFGARYYDPRTGRFLQEDRLNGDDVHPQQQYLYAEGNPTNLVDPSGETAIALPVGLGAVCVTSVAGALICAAGAVALGLVLVQTGKAVQDVVAKGTFCPIEKADSSKDFPANPDDWVPPEGVKEELKAKEGSQGKHRQWKDASGKTVRRWDKGEPGKPRNRGRDHWHDPINRPGEHISPNR